MGTMTTKQKIIWLGAILVALGMQLYVWRDIIFIWLRHVNGLNDFLNK
jgi:hypothetical protein